VLAIKDFLMTRVGSYIFPSTWTLFLLISMPINYFKHCWKLIFLIVTSNGTAHNKDSL